MGRDLDKWIHFKDLKTTEESVEAFLSIGDDFPFFQGHFPGNPVLPAVAIMDISSHFLKHKVSDISLVSISAKKSKFMEMIRPNQELRLRASTSDGKKWNVSWLRQDDDTLMASVSLLF